MKLREIASLRKLIHPSIVKLKEALGALFEEGVRMAAGDPRERRAAPRLRIHGGGAAAAVSGLRRGE